MRDQTFMTLMRLLPKSALSSAMGHARRLPLPAKVHQLAMRAFAQQYGVELDEAEHALEGYPNFSQFFARKLKPVSQKAGDFAHQRDRSLCQKRATSVSRYWNFVSS